MDLVDTYNVGCGNRKFCWVYLLNQWMDQYTMEFFAPRKMPGKIERNVITLAGTPHASYTWSPYLAPVIDQGAFPTCWAHSIIVMAEAVYFKRNPSLPRKSFNMIGPITMYAYYNWPKP